MNFQSTTRRCISKNVAAAIVSTLIFGTGGAAPAVLLGGDTYTTESEGGRIFRLQGEYMGVLEGWDGNWGAQVIAKSKDSLEIHLLKGGLPGAGFNGGEPTKSLTIKLEDGKDNGVGGNENFEVVLKPDTLAIVEKGAGEGKDLKKVGVLNKVLRESKTLGLKPPADAIILFGDGANDFEGAKKVGENLGVGGTSRTKLGDHILHIEFKTPFQPSDAGQARGNSGVYIQGRYELQVLDSFGLRGEDNECGGIYQIARPKLNMCYPPLSWQTYDIEFKSATYGPDGKKATNARVTIKHNGVAIHEDLELPRQTPGKDQESDSPGGLFLQDHGNPVVFRNIWVQKIAQKRDGGPKVQALAE